MDKPIDTVAALLLAAIIAVTAATTIVSIGQQQEQLAYAIEPDPCPQCAKEFAPGQEKVDSDFESTSAKPFAPGQEAGIEPGPCGNCKGASEFAPGQEKFEPQPEPFP